MNLGLRHENLISHLTHTASSSNPSIYAGGLNKPKYLGFSPLISQIVAKACGVCICSNPAINGGVDA